MKWLHAHSPVPRWTPSDPAIRGLLSRRPAPRAGLSFIRPPLFPIGTLLALNPVSDLTRQDRHGHFVLDSAAAVAHGSRIPHRQASRPANRGGPPPCQSAQLLAEPLRCPCGHLVRGTRTCAVAAVGRAGRTRHRPAGSRPARPGDARRRQRQPAAEPGAEPGRKRPDRQRNRPAAAWPRRTLSRLARPVGPVAIGAGHCIGRDRHRIRLFPHHPHSARPYTGRTLHARRARRKRLGRNPHNTRHCAVGTVRGDAVLSRSAADRLPVRHRVESANRHTRRSGWRVRIFRRHTALCRHAADIRHRPDRRGAYRADVRHLPVRIRTRQRALRRQAGHGSARRHPDGGLRLFRRDHGRTLYSWRW